MKLCSGMMTARSLHMRSMMRVIHEYSKLFFVSESLLPLGRGLGTVLANAAKGALSLDSVGALDADTAAKLDMVRGWPKT